MIGFGGIEKASGEEWGHAIIIGRTVWESFVFDPNYGVAYDISGSVLLEKLFSEYGAEWFFTLNIYD
jgi:hypothetical protein